MTASRQLNENLKKKSTVEPPLNAPLRVVYAWNYVEWGGAQIYFLGVASRIKDRACVSMVFPRATSRLFLDFCDHFGVEYEFLETANDLAPAPTLGRKFERHFRKWRAERELVRDLEKRIAPGTVLHVELAPWQSINALVRLSRKAPLFVTMHNRLPPAPAWRRWWWKLKLKTISRYENFRVFASNRDARESLRPLVPPALLERVEITYTNVNPDEVEAALAADLPSENNPAQAALPAASFLVFCVGQFIDRKGRWVFLEAARLVSEAAPEIGFVWITNSTLTSEEKSRIDGYGLGENFALLASETIGREHLELMKFLRLADCFALPSFQEGLPISLLEAMAVGLPSISTRVNAIPEAIIDRETGLLIEAGDARALADAVLEIYRDENLRRKLSANGQKHVIENFNEKSVAETVFNAYRKAAGGN